MKKTILIARANILKHKSASVSIFIIIMLVSALISVAVSVLSGVSKDYMAGLERLNSLHSVIVVERDQFEQIYEDTIKNDPRVSQYEMGEVLSAPNSAIYYGGNVEMNMFFADIEKVGKISTPMIIDQMEQEISEAQGDIIYLPKLAQSLGYKAGDPFAVLYKNRPFDFTVAGFFETGEFAGSDATMKVYVRSDTFAMLDRYMSRSIFAAIRFHEPFDSIAFGNEFSEKTDIEMSAFDGRNMLIDLEMLSMAAIMPVSMFSALILIFAIILDLILIIVIRFRVTNSIENAMFEIGVLKASGYTNRQVISCYILEYAMLSIPAAVLGTIVSIPMFKVVRDVFSSISGFSWTLSINVPMAFASIIIILLVILFMVMRSSVKIKNLPPVVALRGGIASNNFRRNFLPLDKGSGNVHVRLGFKNMFAYIKLYAMIGIIVAGISLALTFVAALYQNFVFDQTAFIKIAGYELSDVVVNVTAHTDANSLALEIENMPEVRKTSMMDMISLKVEGFSASGYASDDFERWETFGTTEGRMPKYDNEVAFPKLFADQLGKTIGDSVKVTVNGVTLDYVITGHYSVASNGGRVVAITLGGYQQLNPGYKRGSINVYLNEGVAYDEFSERLKEQFGVLNEYRTQEDSEYAAAKARAEEKISNYMQLYNIDSVDYAVIYNGEIILSGSSSSYQIEKIADFKESIKAQISTYGDTVSAGTQLISAVSLVILALILSMTINSIVARRRKELGTLKACGYTAKQLARQMAISILPMTILGAAIGCIAGALILSPALSLMFASAGVSNISMSMNPLAVLALGIAIILVTYLVANVSAMKIKRISVYELLSE